MSLPRSACAAAQPGGVWDTKVSHGSSLHIVFLSPSSRSYIFLYLIYFCCYIFPSTGPFSSSSSWFLHNAPSDLSLRVWFQQQSDNFIRNGRKVAIITCLTPPQSSKQTVCGEINSNFPFWPPSLEREAHLLLTAPWIMRLRQTISGFLKLCKKIIARNIYFRLCQWQFDENV